MKSKISRTNELPDAGWEPDVPPVTFALTPAPHNAPPPNSPIALASYGITIAIAVATIVGGLLPGLLALCAAVLITQALLAIRLPWGGVAHKGMPKWMAATFVIVTPLVGLVILMGNMEDFAPRALVQYQSLLQHLVATVESLRLKLPPVISGRLPEGTEAAQVWVAEQLRGYAGNIAMMGRAWLHTTLQVYVAIVVGALLAVAPRDPAPRPLVAALYQRGANFFVAFRAIVVAQAFIAGFNAACTALLLYAILPAFDIRVPYSAALVSATLVINMIPIVGNLITNTLLTLAGASVSVGVAVACLVFMVLCHKTEFVFQGAVVGARARIQVWQLLAVMFSFEAFIGVIGLVVAPMLYVALRKELVDAGLVGSVAIKTCGPAKPQGPELLREPASRTELPQA